MNSVGGLSGGKLVVQDLVGEPSEKRPLVVLIAPYFPPAYYGGVVQIYLGLITRLKEFRVVVVSDHHACDTTLQQVFDTRSEEVDGFRVVRIRAFEIHLKKGQSWWRSLREVFNFFRRGRREWKSLSRQLNPDLLICGGTCSAGWLLRGTTREFPLVTYIHGEELTMNANQRLLMHVLRRCQMQLIRRADLNIVVSRYTGRLTQRLAHISEDRLTVLPNFVDTSRFQPPLDRGKLRAGLGWHEALVILSVARLDPRKGLDQALRALALLHRDQRLPTNWRYVIGGRGSEQATLEALSHELGISDRVYFIGFVADEQLAGIYGAADVFLQPNREIAGDTEGFGVVFLEANACGIPVIGGSAGGTGDAIEEGESGFRVDGESVPEIAGALEQLCNDAALRKQMGAKGAARVRRDFTAEAAATRFGELLTTVLQEHHARYGRSSTRTRCDT